MLIFCYNTSIVKKKSPMSKTISNRRARHDYALDDSLVVGIALNGRETKALRRGHGNLRGSYVTVKDNELYLFNATITGDNSIPIPEEEQTQSRKLLAKRREIDELIAAKQQGRTIVPLEILTRGRYIKVRIAAGRGQKKYDKRQVLKARDEKRSIDTAIKSGR
jgi:SsrA-binding protein